MKAKLGIRWVIGLGVALCTAGSVGHEVPVHRAITVNAAASASGGSSTYTNFLAVISADCNETTATNAMNDGSAREDDTDQPGDAGKKRAYNHFYDPLDGHYGKGLSDYPGDFRVLTGTNSFRWATISNCLGLNFKGHVGLDANVGASNTWSWQNARGYEWEGLTASNSSARHDALTNMFRAVGQVMHLLQDASQPQHVRNEQHLTTGPIWKSPIEYYGKHHFRQLNYQHGMLDWRTNGFTKLEDFWDRHKYDGTSATPLDNDAAGGAANQLGMAEFCNGNFLGVRHTYREFFKTNSISYYPFPSLADTDRPRLNAHNLAGTLDLVTLHNLPLGYRAYIAKTNSGVSVTHHSALTYMAAKNLTANMQVGVTVRDPNVLQEYHSIFIPKAVKYSAGLIDYFFRGQLATGFATDGTNNLVITNTSSQDFTNGIFHLFYDDSGGNRSELTGTNFTTAYTGSVAAGGTVPAFFSPVTNATNYILIYQGTIGTSNGTNADPVDAGVAIGMTTFMLPSFSLVALDGGADTYCQSPVYHPGTDRVWSVEGFSGNIFIFDASSPYNVVSTNDMSTWGGVQQVIYDRKNDQMVAVSWNGDLLFIDPVSQSVTPMLSVINDKGVNGYPMAYDSTRGNVLVVDVEDENLFSDDRMVLVNCATKTILAQTTNTTGMDSPLYCSANDVYYISLGHSNTLFQIQPIPTSGQLAITNSGFSFPFGTCMFYGYEVPSRGIVLAQRIPGSLDFAIDVMVISTSSTMTNLGSLNGTNVPSEWITQEMSFADATKQISVVDQVQLLQFDSAPPIPPPPSPPPVPYGETNRVAASAVGLVYVLSKNTMYYTLEDP